MKLNNEAPRNSPAQPPKDTVANEFKILLIISSEWHYTLKKLYTIKHDTFRRLCIKLFENLKIVSYLFIFLSQSFEKCICLFYNLGLHFVANELIFHVLYLKSYTN